LGKVSAFPLLFPAKLKTVIYTPPQKPVETFKDDDEEDSRIHTSNKNLGGTKSDPSLAWGEEGGKRNKKRWGKNSSQSLAAAPAPPPPFFLPFSFPPAAALELESSIKPTTTVMSSIFPPL